MQHPDPQVADNDDMPVLPPAIGGGGDKINPGDTPDEVPPGQPDEVPPGQVTPD